MLLLQAANVPTAQTLAVSQQVKYTTPAVCVCVWLVAAAQPVTDVTVLSFLQENMSLFSLSSDRICNRHGSVRTHL